MTNDLTIEQAVGELKAMKEHIEPHMSVVGVTAYDMAIKALEQQPTDAILREIMARIEHLHDAEDIKGHIREFIKENE